MIARGIARLGSRVSSDRTALASAPVNESIANDRPNSTPVHETPAADGQNAARSTLRPGSATGVVPSITLSPARENQYQAGVAPVSSAMRLAVKNPTPHSTAPPSTRNAGA